MTTTLEHDNNTPTGTGVVCTVRLGLLLKHADRLDESD